VDSLDGALVRACRCGRGLLPLRIGRLHRAFTLAVSLVAGGDGTRAEAQGDLKVSSVC
jgi:hypothetical protein